MTRSRVRLSSVPLSELPEVHSGSQICPLDSGQIVHTQCASVFKRCNLVLANERQCSAVVKVTMDLLSHRASKLFVTEVHVC